MHTIEKKRDHENTYLAAQATDLAPPDIRGGASQTMMRISSSVRPGASSGCRSRDLPPWSLLRMSLTDPWSQSSITTSHDARWRSQLARAHARSPLELRRTNVWLAHVHASGLAYLSTALLICARARARSTNAPALFRRP